MIDPRRFEKVGVRDGSRSVTSRLYAYPRVAFAMHNKGRDSNGGEDGAHIDLAVHAHQRDHGRGTCTDPLVAGPGLFDARIGRFARRQIWQASPRTPVLLDVAEKLLQLLLRQDPGREMTVGAVKDKRLRPLGISAANSTLIAPPSEMPNRAARSLPAASITARTSSIPSSSVATAPTLSERPVPRLSNRISRLKELRREKKRARAGLSQAISRLEMKPGMKTMSNGPFPTT